MPSVEENKETWNNPITWKNNRDGDKWSERYGNVNNQWIWTILPRIQRYIPTGTILEIAPGFGRWTNYLKDLCKELVVVDVSDLCIQRCKERFSVCKNITYYVNDGLSLSMIPDHSIDFAFSFDSLVHAEGDVIQAYVFQLSNKLKPNGVGWLHHSNLEPNRLFFQSKRFLGPFHKGISKALSFRSHWRSWSMTAERFEQLSEKAGMRTISQEKLGNGYGRLADCISVFTPKNSVWARPNKIFTNRLFAAEGRHCKKLSILYTQ